MYRVLHVEFSQFTKKIFRHEFEKQDFKYYDQPDVSGALEFLKGNPVDVILSGMGLEMEFEEFLEKLNHEPQFADIPVFILTGNDSMKERIRLFEYGVLDYFTKKQPAQHAVNRIKSFLHSEHEHQPDADLRIAVLDDSLTELTLIRKILTRMGYRNSFYARTTAEIQNRIADFDLFLLDYVLENETAFDLIRQIRKENPGATVIVISGIANYKIISHALMGGADDYILKPFNIELFQSRIKSFIRGFRYQKEVERQKSKIEIEHRRKMDELEFAQQLQLEWIPQHFPNNERLTCAGIYLPMEELGGDYYDFFAVDENQYFFVISDVSGHGVSSSLITSMQKILFQSYFGRTDDPGLILTQINRQLVTLLSLKGYFFTSVCLFVDLNAMTMKYSVAAHPNMLLFHADGNHKLLPISKRGGLIGVFDDMVYTTETHPIRKGDRIVLYTDGIVESINPDGTMYEEERLIKRLITDLNSPPCDSIDNLIAELYEFKGPGNPTEDDITMLVIDVK